MNQATQKMTACLWSLPFALVLVTVWAVNPELGNGVVSAKYFWFYGAMGIVAIFVPVACWFHRKEFRIHVVDWFVLIFVVLVVLNQNSVTAQLENTTRFRIVGLLFLLYVYLRIFIIRYPGAVYFLILVFLVTGWVEAVWGLRQLYGWEASYHSLFRLTGSFFNPGPYAGYLAMVAPVALYYLLSDGRVVKRPFCLRLYPFYIRFLISAFALGSIVLVLPAAMSRASWLGCLGGCGLAAGCYYWKKRKVRLLIRQHKKRWIAGFVLSCILLTGLGVGMYYLKKDSADGRALMWKISARMIPGYPLGVGLGNFSGMYGKEQAAYFASGEGTEQEEYIAGNPEYAFNEYLQMAIELGIIPFICFVMILIMAACQGIKNKKTAALSSLVSLLIFAGMSYPFSILPFGIALVFLVAVLVSDPELKTNGFNVPKKLNLIVQFIVLLFSSLTVFYLIKDQIDTYNAYKKWPKATILYHAGLYQEGVKTYAELQPCLSDQVSYLFEYGQCLSRSGQFAESNRILEQAVSMSCDPMLYNVMGKNYQALKNYTASENSFRMAANIVPNRIYPYYLLTKLYLETGDSIRAIKAARIVQTKEPKVQSSAVKEIRKEVLNLIQKK